MRPDYSSTKDFRVAEHGRAALPPTVHAVQVICLAVVGIAVLFGVADEIRGDLDEPLWFLARCAFSVLLMFLAFGFRERRQAMRVAGTIMATVVAAQGIGVVTGDPLAPVLLAQGVAVIVLLNLRSARLWFNRV